MRILVSILSKYLIPNFLVAKELEGQYDKHLFISTKEMKKEDKGLFLEKALGLQEHSVQRIPTVDDDFCGIKNSLVNKCSKKADDEFIVNLTGGTKIMSLALYEYFSKYSTTTFLYVPFEKNVICDISNNKTHPLLYRSTLKEYFLLNGMDIDVDDSLKSKELANSVFELCKKRSFSSNVMSYLRSQECQIEGANHHYLMGKWFEEYVYYRLQDELQLNKEHIATSVKVYDKKIESRPQNDNEADIVFVKDNKLYVIECKVTMTGPATVSKYGTTVPPSVKDTSEKYLYKLAAIVKDYGFKVNSYLFTLHNLSKDKGLEQIERRQKLLGVSNIYDCSVFAKESPLFNFETGDVQQK